MSDVTRALAVFGEAVDRPDAERAAYLDVACAGDAALRAQVEKMLAADARGSSLLPEVATAAARIDRSGERIGAYRLDALVGSGGMGSVYRATRADGAYDKPVAIKLLAFDAGDLRARFAREQRILGHLRHTHIATLLDVGTDAHGAPFLVMEYIDGVPITRFAQERALPLRARIELFLGVLDAAQDAHEQLIVHRDIKPGNVLVDAHGTAKLLDFGIAKILADDADLARTRTGLTPLTPEYASPEQARGEPVGVASDIYSLGVLLFELVTGQRPYSFIDTRPSTIERVVCDTWPPAPSSLSGVQASGVDHDMDAVLLRALEKTPQRRYRSCAEFAADLRRWLRDEPVLARTPTRAERLRRVVRRHRLAVASATVVALALIVGSAVALWQAHVAHEQASVATHERDRAKRINQFLEHTLGAANPSDLGRKATVVDVLARARKTAETDLASNPVNAASMQLVLAETYRALADYASARDCAERARSLLVGQDDASLQIDADIALASAQYDLGKLDQAKKFATLALDRAGHGGTAIQRGSAVSLLGEIASDSGDIALAYALYDRALAEFPASAVEERSDVLINYGGAAHNKGDDALTLSKYREAIKLLADANRDNSPAAIAAYGNLAAALRVNGKPGEAIEVLTQRVLPKQIEILGENSPDVVWTLTNLSTMAYESGDKVAMLDYAQRATRIAEHLPDSNQWKMVALKRYGISLIRTEEPAQAKAVIERALSLARAIFPADNFNIDSLEGWLGLALAQTGERQRGETLTRNAYERLLAKYGAKYEITVSTKKNLDQIQALSSPQTTAPSSAVESSKVR